MAVSQKLNSNLQLAFESGMDAESGKVILKKKSFNNVKIDATADQLLAVATALVPLQQLTLHSVSSNNTELISAE